jgi:hypothetical protein
MTIKIMLTVNPFIIKNQIIIIVFDNDVTD